MRIADVPEVHDADAASRLLKAIDPVLKDLGAGERDLVAAVGGCSPYLSRLIVSQQTNLAEIFAAPPAVSMAKACAAARGAAGCQDESGVDEAAAMRALRQAKARAALVAGIAEISGAWSMQEAAEALSDFADAALSGAMKTVLGRLARKGFAPARPDDPETDCGVTILAMGKHGARELNYSSDIDVIVLYDPNAPALGEAAREIAIAAARGLVRLMQEPTAEGYVFRTDLRLRPDPGVSAAAISIGAAESYYEAYGQNWERAAFIKARAAAGDVALGEEFLKSMRPFVWRKYLDYAAIDDILSIKRQIHAAKGGGSIEFFGHDLKIGRGGIREIEFLVQTQQLILGGKNPALRGARTLDALAALRDDGRIDAGAHDDLRDAYAYLRRVEHRIQMINDEQTHKIPQTEAGVDRLAAFLGEPGPREFETRLRAVLRATHGHFSNLFDTEDRLACDLGTLSFTGVENNPETLRSLRALGFKRPEHVSEAMRQWHAGGVRATRTCRARELLTALTPRLLESLAKASDPDEAFVAFEGFLGRLPSGVQIFSLFAHSPEIFDELTKLMTIAPALARNLARRLHLVEALIERDWPGAALAPDTYRARLDEALRAAPRYEDKLNAARRFAAEEKFQISARLVLATIPPREAARAYSVLADAVLAAMLPVARAETEAVHGRIEGEIAVLGLGRLGAGAMTATSDVDLMFVYDADPDAVSDGAKPLGAVSYFARLTRRYLTALSAATEEGGLYEVDMNLRPSGRAGPAAVSRSAFTAYFENDAWTWEIMALTKARVITGDDKLRGFIDGEIARIIARPRERAAVAADVHAMRERLHEAKRDQGPWDVKNVRGGLTDLEFIRQYEALLHGRVGSGQGGGDPGAQDGTIERTLSSASELFESVLQVSRAATDGVFDPEGSGLALKTRLSQACGEDRLEAAQSLIIRTQCDVIRAYERIVESALEPDS